MHPQFPAPGGGSCWLPAGFGTAESVTPPLGQAWSRAERFGKHYAVGFWVKGMVGNHYSSKLVLVSRLRVPVLIPIVRFGIWGLASFGVLQYFGHPETLNPNPHTLFRNLQTLDPKRI